MRDITERKQAQKKLRDTLQESQSRLLISTLTSGIVHEIRNPLVAIKGFFDIWNDQRTDKETTAKFGALALKEVSRIEHLLTGFLALAKPSPKLYRFTTLSGVINTAMELGMIEAKKRYINILFLPEKQAYSIFMDPKQIEGVFLNIIMNAIDSMSAGGRLVISTRYDLKRTMINIIFRDNGCGIPKDILAQLYKPFFTTKKKGTGLGLMISRRIIEEHDGKMEIKSIPKKGTTVTVSLPIAKKAKGRKART
jgi:two-component system, sporulation sensor kinase E